MIIKKITSIKGFTLIEFLLYITLLSIFVVTAVSFLWNIIYGREKNVKQQVVQQNARIVMSKIGYEIQRAKDVISINPLILDNGNSTTKLEIIDGKMFLTSGVETYALSSNQVTVDSISFMSSTGPVSNDSKNITVRLVLHQTNPYATNLQSAETTLEDSYELRSMFNQARKLLINLTTMTNFPATNIRDIQLTNIDTNDVTIDKIAVSWTGVAGGNLTGVQIGGGAVEWTGSQPNGTIVDINNFNVGTPTYSAVFDYLSFDRTMSGATLNLDFIMLDGSTAHSVLTLAPSSITLTPAVTPTATPIVSATPTPTTSIPKSCITSCIQGGYAAGMCRKSCNSGEIIWPDGSTFCKSSQVTTCCCY